MASNGAEFQPGQAQEAHRFNREQQQAAFRAAVKRAESANAGRQQVEFQPTANTEIQSGRIGLVGVESTRHEPMQQIELQRGVPTAVRQPEVSSIDAEPQLVPAA